MSEKDVNENSGSFSWKFETDNALGSYIEKGKDKKSYASSIFSPSQSGTDFSPSSNYDYKYDFPKDEGYIYSPSAHISSSQSKSVIYSDMTDKRASAMSRPQEKRNEANRNQGGKKPSQKQAPRNKGQQSKNKKEKKTSFLSGLGNTKKESVKKDAARKNNISDSRYSQRPPQKRVPEDKRRSDRNTRDGRQVQSRVNREAERERRENVRRDRNNLRFDDSRTRGISADESRRALMKKKQKNRKFFAVVCALILVIGAIFAVVGYGVIEGAPIAKIQVEGSTTYKKKAVLAAAGITVGDNMLLVREKKTNELISTSLPYIESVEVKYEFPDTLKLNIKETADKIHIIMGKTMLTLDGNDKVLSNKKKKIGKENYRILGLQKQDYNIGYKFEADKHNGNNEKYALAKEITAMLEKTGIKGFRDINFEDMKCITISTADGVSIYVNEKTPLERQFNLAKDAIAEKQKSKAKGYFDLRFEEMVVHN